MNQTKEFQIARAKNVLRGQQATLQELLEWARQLKNEQELDYACRLLELARSGPVDDRMLQLDLDREHAICTYKNPDVPRDKRFDEALSILRKVLEYAEGYAEEYLKLDPPERAKRNAKEFKKLQDTFGMAGSIFKRKWQVDAALDPAPAAPGPEAAAPVEQTEAKAKDWWTLVTIAEAYFGLREYAKARQSLMQAAEISKKDNVRPWEYETTVKQLAELARLWPLVGVALVILEVGFLISLASAHLGAFWIAALVAALPAVAWVTRAFYGLSRLADWVFLRLGSMARLLP